MHGAPVRAPDPVWGLVRRPRLIERLEDAGRRPVTLVTGPAGSGKTLLVDAWLRERRSHGRVGSVSVSPGERDAARFWDAVIGALGSADRVATADTIADPDDREPERRLDEELLRHDVPAVLVIDDLQRLESAAARRQLAALLERDLPGLRVVLVSRGAPNLGLHRLRLAGGLAELGARDLAFTTPEACELLARAGLHLAPRSVGALQERTEGWAAGLRLAAQWLAGSHDPDASAGRFSGAERTVADYLRGEVLAGQPPGVWELLLCTSVLRRVNGPLATLLARRADGERMLQDLEDHDALVTSVDEDRSWFRYHPLLADLLRLELRRRASDQIEPLHRSAAHWHAEHGEAIEAVRHAEAAGDWRYAGELLQSHWLDRFLDGEQSALGSLLAALPAAAVAADPELAALFAADRLAGGRVDVGDGYLELARRLAGSVRDDRRSAFELTLAVATLVRASARGNVGATREAAAVILAPPGTRLRAAGASYDDLRALVSMHLGFAEAWARRSGPAEQHLREGLALARQIGRPYVAIGCLRGLAELDNVALRLDVAEVHAREAIELADAHGLSEHPIAAGAHLALGGALLGRGLLEESESPLDRAARLMRGRLDLEAGVVLRTTRGVLSFAQGRYELARDDFRDVVLACEHNGAPPIVAFNARGWELRAGIRLGDLDTAREALAQAGDAARELVDWCNLAAHLHLAEDDPAAAVEALGPALDGSASRYHLVHELEALLLEAVARDGLGQAAAAEEALERALQCAQPGGVVWIILAMPAVRRLLERHPRHRTVHGAFIAELLDHFAGADASRLGEAVPLGPREMDVLGFLPSNLTAAEIAGQLVLSVHTVKTHMRTVYAKLRVHRRAEAVERARALGLLAPARRRGG